MKKYILFPFLSCLTYWHLGLANPITVDYYIINHTPYQYTVNCTPVGNANIQIYQAFILPNDGETVHVCTITILNANQNASVNISLQNLTANLNANNNATNLQWWRIKENSGYQQDMLTLPSAIPTTTLCQDGTAKAVNCTTVSKTKPVEVSSNHTMQQVFTTIN